MNCLEYRRLMLAQPRSDRSDLREHRQACDACARFTEELHSVEHAVRQSVKVPVPESLASRVMLRHEMRQAQAARRHRTVWAMAASLVLVVAGAWFINHYQAPLQTVVMQHIENEIAHLGEQNDVSPGELQRRFHPIGISLGKIEGPIHYAGVCPIRDSLGGHLILAGRRGPVTVLFMPGESLSQRQEFTHTGFIGRLIPTEYGSVSIVGMPGEDLGKIEDQVLPSV